MVSVGIVGGSGYMGGEALRVLLRHPHAEVAWVTSRAPGPIEQVHPNLYGTGLHFVRLDEVKTTDFVLLALPTGPSMDVAARFLKAGARVIDLGSAFRLRDRAIWERVYGQKHAAWPLVNEAVYGIPELHEEGIRTTRLVANPGCFSSAAILGLAPLLKTGLVEAHRIVVNGLSGTAGAGAEFSRAIHHPEIGGNVVFYGSTTLNRDQVAPFATSGHERWLNAFRWTSSPLGWHPRWRRDLIAQQLGHGPRVVG